MQMLGDIQDVSDQSSQEEAFMYEEDDLGEDEFYDEFDEMQGGNIMNENGNNDLAISPITISAQKHKRTNEFYDEFDEMQGGNIMNENENNDLTISPITISARKHKRTNANTNVVTSEEVNNNNHSPSNENIHNKTEDKNTHNTHEEEPNNTPYMETQPINTNTVIQRQTPVVAQVANVDKNIAKKRKSNNKWQIILFIIASIVIIGALVLAILAALGVFKKKDDTPPAGNDTGNNVNNTTNITDNDVNINDNNNPISNNDSPNIKLDDNIDGKYDAGILGDDSYHGSTTISNHDWDGISKSGDLFTNGDITYTDRFKKIVSCENSPNVTYTLWEDLNNDGICQVDEILAKGKGFMVDGNCAIIDGRKFALTDNMQAYSNLNKLSNQELKVLNHTSTYYEGGRPHIIMDGLRTSVNIDTDHVGGVLNIEGYKIGDFSTTNISKNAFAKDVVDSYLNNNSLTENQKKLISAWNSGRSSDNVKQLMGYQEMDNNQSGNNLKNTHHGKEQNI